MLILWRKVRSRKSGKGVRSDTFGRLAAGPPQKILGRGVRCAMYCIPDPDPGAGGTGGGRRWPRKNSANDFLDLESRGKPPFKLLPGMTFWGASTA